MPKIISMMLFSNLIMKTRFTLTVFAALLCVSGCSIKMTNHHQVIDNEYQQWLQTIVNYRQTINPSSISSNHDEPLFQISDEMRSIVRIKFSHLPKRKAMIKLVEWLVDADKYGMQYELNANVPPIEAFEQKQANCLSFTILLVHLSKELGIELQYNNVHLPDIWGLDTGQSHFTLFRHVNAIRKTRNSTQIFDLAIEDYDYGFPQNVISEKHAIALLYSNIAIDYLKSGNSKQALHYIKYAISLYSESADLWVNLGVIYKSQQQYNNAERSLLYAIKLDQGHYLAASNLERIYLKLQKTEKADYFKKHATKARKNNPYLHYVLARQHLKFKRYKSAIKAIDRAKKLHNNDPRFYVLSSAIHQHSKKLIQAIKDLQTAQTLTVDNKQRQKYVDKARLLVTKLQNEQSINKSGRKPILRN